MIGPRWLSSHQVCGFQMRMFLERRCAARKQFSDLQIVWKSDLIQGFKLYEASKVITETPWLTIDGMTATRAACRAAMALLGTGSVSAYVVQHAELPVAVVRQDLQLLGALQAPVRFCIWPRRG